MDIRSVRRALLSVTDKSGLLDLAETLIEHGAEILSTGGTAEFLKKAGIKITDVSDYTNFPEMMGGRLKTLHPLVHGGILLRRGIDEEIAQEHGILAIDLLVVNLYAFELTAAKDGVSEAEVIEQIDIGGPAMLRSAAKNFRDVSALSSVDDYEKVIREIKELGGVSLDTRRDLAVKAFELTSHYDQKIAEYLRYEGNVPEKLDLHYEKVMSLRYGENPHQKAVFFRDPGDSFPNVTNAKILQGKQLSFNNIIDTDAALEIVKDFDKPAVAIIKHTNPCGAATAEKIEDALDLAYEADPMAAFGCVIAANRNFNDEMADIVLSKNMFVEIIIAPSFDQEALAKLASRKNLRLLEVGTLRRNPNQRNIKTVSGGILVQTADQYVVTEADLRFVTLKQAEKSDEEALLFARILVKHVKSNAVVFAKAHEKGGCMTTGIGAGQMSRVDSVIIAKRKGGENVRGSVMASDAFFPFPDAVVEAYDAGISAIIQPGGSIRDEDVIKKADDLGVAMVFTGIRSFKH